MSFIHWLRNLRSALATDQVDRTHRRRSLRAARYRPRLEALEERIVPSFTAPVSYLTGGYVEAVVAGDFNGDGKIDLVESEYDWNPSNQFFYTGVRFRAGDGTGTFGAAIDLNVRGLSNPLTEALAAADFNGDGRLDLAVCVCGQDGYDGYTDYPTTNHVQILLGNGDGTFAHGAQVLSTANPEGYYGQGDNNSLVVGDFNGDGNKDVAAGGWAYALGTGDGSFSPGVYSEPDSIVGPGPLAAGDFDADGRTDLVLPRGPTMDVLFGQADGTFRTVSYATPASRVAVGDFNGDGHPDVNASDGSGSVVVLNDGLGGFGPPIAGPAFDGKVGDLDADGRDDLVGYQSVYLSRGDGTFYPGLPVAGASRRAVADLNGDGYDDLAWNYQSSYLRVQLNRADWSSAQSFVVTSAAASTTAGAPLTFTVTARNSYGQTVPYAGTVHFTSTDPKAALPVDYTFTAADNGVHTFTATLKTAGSGSITVKDVVTAGLAGTLAGVTVNPAAATRLAITGPAQVGRVSFSITVTAYDPYGNVATGYTGTVRFTSSDGTATLPANYKFTAADQGVHTFTSLVFAGRKKGNQTITVTDTFDGSILGSLIIKVM